MAFGFDRRDVAEQLVAASDRGCSVWVGVDRRSALSGTPKEGLQVAQFLEQNGVDVKCIDGVNMHSEYLAVNRAGSGLGIHHCKVLLADRNLLFGSTNWTTATRANHEFSGVIALNAAACTSIREMLRARLEEGTDLSKAQRYRSKSVSTTRSTSQPAGT